LHNLDGSFAPRSLKLPRKDNLESDWDTDGNSDAFADNEGKEDFVDSDRSIMWISGSEDFLDDCEDLPVLDQPVETCEEHWQQQQRNPIQVAELLFNGSVERAGGAKDKTGKARGPYGVGGKSERTTQRKIKELREAAEASEGKITEKDQQQQIELVKQQQWVSDGTKQGTISYFFKGKLSPEDICQPVPMQKRSRPAESMDIIEDSTTLPVELDLDTEAPQSSSGEEVEMSPGEVVQQKAEDKSNEYLDVLGEDMPSVSGTFSELQALCVENLKIAWKKKIYTSEVWFAALSDLYRWAPQQGRIKASRRVMQNHGRGDGFA